MESSWLSGKPRKKLADDKAKEALAKVTEKAKALESQRAARIGMQEANLAIFNRKKAQNIFLPANKCKGIHYKDTCHFCYSLPTKHSVYWHCLCDEYAVCKVCYKLFYTEVGEHLVACPKKNSNKLHCVALLVNIILY